MLPKVEENDTICNQCENSWGEMNPETGMEDCGCEYSCPQFGERYGCCLFSDYDRTGDEL